jgi:hypothetical protein
MKTAVTALSRYTDIQMLKQPCFAVRFICICIAIVRTDWYNEVEEKIPGYAEGVLYYGSKIS